MLQYIMKGKKVPYTFIINTYLVTSIIKFIIFQLFKSTRIKFEKMKSLLLCPDVMMTQLNALFMKRRRL